MNEEIIEYLVKVPAKYINEYLNLRLLPLMDNINTYPC